MSLKKWIVPKYDKNMAKEIAQKYNIDGILALLLLIRGYTSKEEIENFINAQQFFDPFLIKDMEKAVQRINYAVDEFEPITIYGDYDADGITATTILYSYLEGQNANVSYYIPQRLSEGYGMNVDAVRKIAENGTKLIITVDNGISAINEIDLCNELGIDVVITDHHSVPEKLPNAYAIVDPHRKDCESEYKNYCGAGVVFKLICALEGEGSHEYILEDYADLIAIGTIADIVSLDGENRAIVKKGLEVIEERHRLGLNKLIDVAGIKEGKLSAGDVAFKICPRINATGRLGNAKQAVELFLNDQFEQDAEFIASQINQENATRQDTEQEILDSAIETIENDNHILLDRVIVVAGENWHQGVIGIVASRLVERYGKPVIVITKIGDLAFGSGRSIAGFSLFEGISHCSELLVRFGGHPLAAGLTIETENINQFRIMINSYAKSLGSMPFPTLQLDCNLNPNALSIDIVEQISILEPFGMGNTTPVFGVKNMIISVISPLSGGKHIKLTLARGECTIQAYLFNCSFDSFPYVINDEVDIAVNLSKNEFRGNVTLSIVIKDIKPSNLQSELVLEDLYLYQSFLKDETLEKHTVENIIPTRDDNALIYRYLKTNGSGRYTLSMLYYRLEKLSYIKMLFCLDILEQSGLIKINKFTDYYDIELVSVVGKVDLEKAPILLKLKAQLN